MQPNASATVDNTGLKNKIDLTGKPLVVIVGGAKPGTTGDDHVEYPCTYPDGFLKYHQIFANSATPVDDLLGFIFKTFLNRYGQAVSVDGAVPAALTPGLSIMFK